MNRILTVAIVAGFTTMSTAAIDITVDAQKGIKKISPYIYGRNIDKVSDTKAESDSTEEAFIAQMLDAGFWNQKNSLNISVPHAGKYILRIGKQNHSITVK